MYTRNWKVEVRFSETSDSLRDFLINLMNVNKYSRYNLYVIYNRHKYEC